MLALVACGKGVEPTETGSVTTPPTLDERPCPEASVVTWDNFAGPFFRDWCTGCHSPLLPEGQRGGAPADVNLTEHVDALALSGRIFAMAADQNAVMPPVGGPPLSERALLGDWLACGAP